MTHEDFMALYQTEDENIIVNPQVVGIFCFDGYVVISPKIQARFIKWLDAHPLLKALR